MRILGIETSFDDTGVAIYDDKLGLLVNELRHQNNIHSKYGGVVPELASRAYINQVAPLIKEIIIKNNISLNSLNGIAYTAGPGLVGSLLVGAGVGCALAYACNIPSIPINHMEGHLLSPMIENPNLKFPFLGLLISGKHTQLINAYQLSEYQILGETVDDAAGEVLDKVAQALNLGYPGGYLLSQFANKGKLGRFYFPKPMKYYSNFNFSFSGLKTFTLNLIKKHMNNIQALHDIACEFEYSILDVLVYKSFKALKKTGYNQLVIAGGVSANKKLINLFKKSALMHNKKLYFCSPVFCTDNAAMIAYLGMIYLKRGISKKIDISIYPKWSILNIKQKNHYL